MDNVYLYYKNCKLCQHFTPLKKDGKKYIGKCKLTNGYKYGYVRLCKDWQPANIVKPR